MKRKIHAVTRFRWTKLEILTMGVTGVGMRECTCKDTSSSSICCAFGGSGSLSRTFLNFPKFTEEIVP